MQLTFNITTSPDDLGRYGSSDSLADMLRGFDGVELMCLGDDKNGIVKKDFVKGLHLGSFPYWLDFWNGDKEALLSEFGSLAECENHYGGTDRNALVRFFASELETAVRYAAEYVVFHVSDASVYEGFTRNYRHSSKEVIDASCELMNEVLSRSSYSGMLLLENLWVPGLTFTEPDMTKRLLDGIERKNKGIMLDTGHLFNTNTAIRTQEQGLEYINSMLDLHGSLSENIVGVHLNCSITGGYCAERMKHPPKLLPTYSERCMQMFEHAFRVDEHKPFTCAGVDKLIERIAPEYLTFEFISRSKDEHIRLLAQQRTALGI